MKFLLPVIVIVIVIVAINVAQAAPLVPQKDPTTLRWCDLMTLVKNIIDFVVYYLIFPITAVMIVVGGLFIMTASSSETRFAKGKEIVTAAVVGLLIALTSWVIINTIMGIAVDYDDIVGRPWNELRCE